MLWKVTAKGYNSATGKWDAPVEYVAQTHEEAENWIKFNKDWMVDFSQIELLTEY
jgi:hypothetical protein